jgi:protein-tyrosine-phosphatase
MAALRSAKCVLIVCHGNIIRSAFAARLVAQGIGGDARVSIVSGGLEAMPGAPPPANAVCTATKLGVDLTGHVSAAVAPETVANADVIFVMDIPQLIAIRRRFPEGRAKTFLLTCLAPHGPLEIRDPVEGDESVFQECFDQISRAAGPIVGLLAARTQSGSRHVALKSIKRPLHDSCSG